MATQQRKKRMLNVAEYLPRDLKKRGVEFAIQECVYQKNKKKKTKKIKTWECVFLWGSKDEGCFLAV